jgi:molybdate transport system permease protein
MNHVWNPLLLSLRIAVAATVLVCAVGVPLAFAMSRRKFRGRGVLEAFITMPLVLPPTVVGYVLLVAIGSQSWIGGWLHSMFGISLIFTTPAAVLAGALVSLPMLYMPAKSAFAAIDRDLEDVARLFGASRLQIFWHVSLPLARRGLISGVLLAFARALGEFGATMMVFGWSQRRVTLPISIYTDYEQGDWRHAAPAVMALTVISLVLMFAYNRSPLSVQDK